MGVEIGRRAVRGDRQRGVIAALKGLAHLAPHAHVLALKNEDFSRDPKTVAAMNADPLIAHENQPTRTVAQLAIADDRLKREFPLITLPVFILHGDPDTAIPVGHATELHQAIGDEVVRLTRFGQFGHGQPGADGLGVEDVPDIVGLSLYLRAIVAAATE